MLQSMSCPQLPLRGWVYHKEWEFPSGERVSVPALDAMFKRIAKEHAILLDEPLCNKNLRVVACALKNNHASFSPVVPFNCISDSIYVRWAQYGLRQRVASQAATT